MNDERGERLEQELRRFRSELQRAREDQAQAEARLKYAEQIILELTGEVGSARPPGADRRGRGASAAVCRGSVMAAAARWITRILRQASHTASR